jgi:uncharacterized protein (DUF2236 family)
VTAAERINAERLVLASWSRAILLQVAHPLVAAGVVEHSSFEGSPAASARRLHHTVRAMLGLTFGDAGTHAQVVAGIRGIHRRVHGRLRHDVGVFPAGTPYSAEDPALLLWVHATLLESVVMAYEAIVRPLSPADRDAYAADAAEVAIELGAVPADVPRTWAALEQYLERTLASGAIAVGPDARTVERALLRGGFSRLTGPVAWANRVLTTGWLPPALREQYGLEWNGRRDRAFRRLISVLRRARRALPGVVTRWKDARRLADGS